MNSCKETKTIKIKFTILQQPKLALSRFILWHAGKNLNIRKILLEKLIYYVYIRPSNDREKDN
jgi:hypothetical protein